MTILIYDLLFYILFLGSIFLTRLIMSTKLAAIDFKVLQSQLFMESQEQMTQSAVQLSHFFSTLIISSIILVIVVLSAWTLSRGLIYTKILKKKLTKKYFFKKLIINLLIGLDFFIIALFILAVLANVAPLISRYLIPLIILFYAYYTSTTYIFFTREQKVFKSLGDAVTAIPKIKKLWPVCLLILIVFMILTFIFTIIKLSPLINLLIFALFMTWARMYFIPAADKIL